MPLAIDREAQRLCAILQQRNCVEGLTQFIKLAHQKKQHLKQIINRPVPLYNHRTAVHLAASKGLWECLEMLLKNGGNPNAVSSETDLRQTPLHLAALNGMARCLQILLYYGAKDRENVRHETAQDMVKGKPRCEKILEQAATTMKTPINSTQEKEQQKKESSARQPLSEMIGQVVKQLDETPTLLKLLSFSEYGVNIAEQIGVNYLMFGMILLRDDNGVIVKALEEEHRGNAEKINTAIFQKWLDGKGMMPVTWSTLVTALQQIRIWK